MLTTKGLQERKQLVSGTTVEKYVIKIILTETFPCIQNGGRKECFQILTGKPTGKRTLGRPRRRWEDNIIMDLEICINARN